MSGLKSKMKGNTSGILPIFLGFVVLFIVASIISDSFFTVNNLMNVLRQLSYNCIIAVGMTFVILTGGIDLTVGSVVALVSVLIASMQGLPAPVALLAGLAVGVLVGFVNGIFIVKRKLQPFIVTLAMMTVVKGVAYIYSGGRPILGLSKGMEKLSTLYVGPVPLPAVFMIIIVLVAYFLLRHTYYGRSIYAVGGNEEAAKLSGTHTGGVVISCYMISGLLAAFAAILSTARVGAGEPILGDSWEMDAIAAVAIGGTAMSGGVGSVVGTFIGALILGILSNLFNLLNISAYVQQVVRGVIILVAVIATVRKKA